MFPVVASHCYKSKTAVKTMMVTKRRVIMAITILNLDSGFIFSCNEVLFVELQLFIYLKKMSRGTVEMMLRLSILEKH